jgi:hypothetical protein
MKKLIWITLIVVLGIVSISCTNNSTDTTTTNTNITTSNLEWDGNQIIYNARAISYFGSATPSGVANYNEIEETVSVWNTDASLDNYGGIQTPSLRLDFSKAVIFEMEVVSVYSEYIIKLAVEGENEYYYVISDESRSGTVSINVVDAMLSEKYRTRNTSPDPGYQDGWKYDDMIKNCSFHILAKGPDGERQTAELVISKVAIYNNQTAITDISIVSDTIVNDKIEILKGSASRNLSSTILPSSLDNTDVFWESTDESVVTVNDSGNINPVGVGQAYITVTSVIDQSKKDRVLINVLSGFEDLSLLKSELASLDYQGSSNDVLVFEDLFKTSLGNDEVQAVSVEALQAIDYRIADSSLFIENYFSPNKNDYITEASTRLSNNDAKITINLIHGGLATVYQMIDGGLYKTENTDKIEISYATNSPNWEKLSSKISKYLIVWDNGDVKKLEIDLLSTTLLGDFSPSDLADSDQWIVPNRNLQSEDAVIHALSPALVSLSEGLAEIKQNKYPESKYSFGGIVSELFTVETGANLQLIVDVDSLNQKSDFVKTMWEIKVIYYQADGETVINSNPLKVASSNGAGIHIIDFKPAYENFRIYLVTNGSDIGEQFADATVKWRGLKIYQID